MTDRNPPALDDIFRTLDRWRHLPAYRLEPTLAPFFGLFLPDILRRKFGVKTDCTIIPEFPLHKKILCKKGEYGHKNETDNNLSVNVDYAVFQKNHTKAYFVELKTDRRSFREEQLKYLRCAQKAGLHSILDGVLEICKTTKQKSKYIHLIHNLQKLDLIAIPDSRRDELYEKTFPKGKSGWSEAFKCVFIAADKNLLPEIEIVYITPDGKCPNENDITNIGFDCVADIVAARGGFGPMFAYYLKRWESQAGEIDPRKIHTWK